MAFIQSGCAADRSSILCRWRWDARNRHHILPLAGSVYFKEPGGALFELATDGPGFDRDEDQAHLGEQLILAPWLEQRCAEIEAVLTPLQLPRADR